jgi:predicted Zn-dependent protease
MNARMLISAIALAALGAAWAGCATNPVSGKREFSLVSPSQELSIGQDSHKAVLEEYGTYDDPQLQAYVDGIGQALARRSHQPSLDWHFTVLDDPVVNAFALPGGYIYVTRGILAHLGSEAQLAGVLGHEIGHVTARHSAQRITQQQVAGLGLGLASVFSEGFRKYGQAAQTGLGLLFLKYGRDDENQADQLGVDYSTAASWDPREIPNTYVTLRRVGERGGQRLPGFLSTHPDPGDREARTTSLAQQAAAGKSGLIVKSADYTRHMDGVVYGPDPRQGYFQGERFVHPDLAFEMTFPSGWQTQNTRASVMAQAPDKAAVMQLTLADGGQLSPDQYVAGLQRDGKIADARGQRETIGGYEAWVGRLAVTRQDGSQGVLNAAFIRAGRSLFQILGQSADAGDANASRINGAIRSFRSLPEAQRRATPDRIKVVAAPRNGTFDEVMQSLGPQAIDLDESSILNNTLRDEEIRRGELLKVVQRGSR